MYLGIDLGTSALKVILIDDDQNLLGEKNIPLEVNRPQTLFSNRTISSQRLPAFQTFRRDNEEWLERKTLVRRLGGNAFSLTERSDALSREVSREHN